jgi:hypothetical protein
MCSASSATSLRGHESAERRRQPRRRPFCWKSSATSPPISATLSISCLQTLQVKVCSSKACRVRLVKRMMFCIRSKRGCPWHQRELAHQTTSIWEISPFNLAARFAIMCHSIANSSQSCFAVGSVDSRARCSLSRAFNRNMPERSEIGALARIRWWSVMGCPLLGRNQSATLARVPNDPQLNREQVEAP